MFTGVLPFLVLVCLSLLLCIDLCDLWEHVRVKYKLVSLLSPCATAIVVDGALLHYVGQHLVDEFVQAHKLMAVERGSMVR